MERQIRLQNLQRLQAPLEEFIELAMHFAQRPNRKFCRADRSFRELKGDNKAEPFADRLNLSFLYDHPKNRWVCHLVLLVMRHLDDLLEGYETDEEARALLESFYEKISALRSRAELGRAFEASAKILDLADLPILDPTLYHAYTVLKYALAEMESEIAVGLSQVVWEERDVLVGSFGSEEQFRHNLAKKYYYAPERHFDPSCFPIRYVALYQSSHFSESGICYYGAVTGVRRVKRKKIRFGVRRQNGEEGYYLFRVKEWKRLSSPIQIQDEGVFAPKYTNLFLLMNCRKTYELFHITSEQDYRVYRQILRILAHSESFSDEKRIFPIEGGKGIRVSYGNLELLDEKRHLMCIASVKDFSFHPTNYIDDFFACISIEPKKSELPLWMIRENEAYEEKYGEPYREDN